MEMTLARPEMPEMQAEPLHRPVSVLALLVVLQEGANISARSLVEFISARVPRFAAPRYIEMVEQLPKTPSERVNKAEARSRGITAEAVDVGTST